MHNKKASENNNYLCDGGGNIRNERIVCWFNLSEQMFCQNVHWLFYEMNGNNFVKEGKKIRPPKGSVHCTSYIVVCRPVWLVIISRLIAPHIPVWTDTAGKQFDARSRAARFDDRDNLIWLA